MRVRHLPHQPRLAHPWLSDDGNNLAVSCRRQAERLSQLLELHIACHEPREPPRSGGVEARPL